ncbi:uncharacterized protein LOC110811421 isoform X2 [Carica papaya]|uniref:uncharacterized protein LOC110811421 isoform X2 n=1 Tax=Carica papaya TaxID=3649 RepID=UPI000B8CEAFA|nr:uncharacterized protein LOC110811421 isoform X2 [Carica papaya]
MLSLTAKSTHLLLSSSSFADLNTHIFSPSFFAINLRTRRNRREISVSSSLLAAKESGSLLGFLGAKRKDNRGSCRWCGGFARGCKRSWSSEGNIELEAGILEFMRNSAKPEVFPSKKELIDAGRMDLVEGIMRQRGWLALGWDSDNEEEEKKGWVQENGANKDFVTETECHNGACQVENETHISSSSATSSGISLMELVNGGNSSCAQYGIDKLVGTNYKYRRMSMKAYLQGQDLWELVGVQAAIPEDTPENTEPWRKWKIKCNKALFALTTSISEEFIDHVHDITSPKEVWETLERLFSQKNTIRLQLLENELAMLTQGGMYICKYFLQVKSICAEIS